MAILNINNVGEHGIITDIAPWMLPPNAWTGGQNIRVRDTWIQKFKGHEEYLDPNSGSAWDNGTGSQVYWTLPVAEGSSYYWIYCGLKDIRIYDGTTDVEVSKSSGAYSASADTNWTGGLLGGIPIVNNGVDDPQFLASFDLVTPVKFADLTNWPASTTCKAMRVFKNYLIAMNVTKSGTTHPALVKWSDGATLGAVPGSWDELDPGVDAGETDLAEANIDVSTGELLDGHQLRDIFCLYKDDSTWAMRFIDGPLIFQFYQISKTQGALSRRCMQEFKGRHFVVSNGDVFVHDGNTVESVIDARRRRFLFSDIDAANYERTYTFHNLTETEMWICYVESGHPSGLPNKALVWNYTHNTWTTRELPDAPHISRGVVDTSVSDDSWDVGTSAISDISVANPTVLTFASTAYNDGDTVIINGSDSTPSVDGSHTITKTSATQGTIPVNVTVQGTTGSIEFSSVAYDDWETWTIAWGTIGFNPMDSSPLLCATKLLKGDSTDQFDGTNMTSRIERLYIPIGTPDDVVRIKRIYPHMEGSGAVNFYVGTHMRVGDPVTYKSPVSFTPGTDRKVDANATGAYLAIKIESNSNIEWSISGFDVEYELTAKR